MKTNAKVATLAERLNSIMEQRDISQGDLYRLCQPYCERYGEKMARSHISQYCSGKTVPGQKKTLILASALQISIGWLMGYETTMTSLSPKTREIAGIIEKLNFENKTKIEDFAKFLLQSQNS